MHPHQTTLTRTRISDPDSPPMDVEAGGGAAAASGALTNALGSEFLIGVKRDIVISSIQT